MEATIQLEAQAVTRREYCSRIISYVKDNPYFGYEEVERGKGVFKGAFESEGVRYVFGIESEEDGTVTGMWIERDRDEGRHVSESAIQGLYEHVRTAYAGYIINRYGLR